MAAADAIAMAFRNYAEGNLSVAEQFSIAVLKDEPNHAESLHLLGLIAKQRGNLTEAIDFLNRSLACNDADAETWKHLGDVQLIANHCRAAVTNYEQALRLQPNFAEAYNNLGLAFQQLGDSERAAEVLRQALRLVPSFASAHNNLGIVLKRQGKLAEASEAFEQAVRQQPEFSEFAYNLAVTLSEQGELDRAIDYYRQALRLRPGFADAYNGLAIALKEQGLLDEAITQFQEALKFQPGHAQAHYNLSKFVAEGLYQFAPEETNRLKALLASGRYSPLDRSHCCFALATLLDKQGSYDEAFGYYQQANDLKKRLLQEQNAAFDAEMHSAFIDRVIDNYDQAYFERVKDWGTDTDLPVFIIGMPRTGSTLVEQILASHSLVFGAGELGEVPQFLSQFMLQANPNLYATHLLPNEHTARHLAADYLKHMANLSQGVARVTIKALQNFLHLGLIATIFPHARVIYCRRDPLDVCLSCYFNNFQKISFAWSLGDIGAYFRSHERLMAHWSRVLPLTIHEACYEDLVQNQETVTRSLLNFCGLDWEERCMTYFKTRRVVRTASSVQVRRPITDKAISRWKHYRTHLGVLFQALDCDLENDT